MAYKYTHFIPQNIAPSGTKQIGVYDGKGKKLFTIPLGRLAPTTKEKSYSFGLLSDIHVNLWSGDNNAETFANALSYFEGQGCNFVCISGDLTNTGFYMYENDATSDEVNWYDEAQFVEYKRICGLHPNMPVYGMSGNHESYVKPITQNIDDLERFTGHGLAYTMEQGKDLFIFVGQSEENTPMSKEHFEWLGTTLEANKDKRCFVFIHPYVDANDSGNPLGLHRTPLFNYTNISKHGYDKSTFINLMASYPNAILFHGHSHMRFENQENVSNANYSTALGFKSVHVPSTAYCRDIRSGAMVNVEIVQGYIVDVYDDCIVLNGMDFINNECVPLGVYKIDTTLQTIAPNTFTDSTGVITV